MAQDEKRNGKDFVSIELGKYGGPIFLGRNEGAAMRKKFNLDACDESDVKVKVIFPGNTKGIGSSFFLAMFGESIRSAGSAEKFLGKYNFQGPEFLISDLVNSSVVRALFEGDLFGNTAG